MPPLCESGSIFRACSWKGCTVTCNSCCETCIAMNKVCTECKEQGQSSHVPSLRACRRCLERNQQCLRAVVLVLATDFESGNKKAFELITESQANGDLNPQFIFICLPDAVHVGKSFKCNRANWMMLLHNERACLSVIRTIRESDPHLKKILARDRVLKKDRMDVDCVLHLSKDSVLSHLESIDRVVHSVVPDSYKIWHQQSWPLPTSGCCLRWREWQTSGFGLCTNKKLF